MNEQFDPDAYLGAKPAAVGFDPDAYLKATAAPQPAQQAPKREPNAIDKFILEKFGSQLAKAPDIQGSMVGRAIMGAADLPLGAMQLGLNVAGAGEGVNRRLAEMNAKTEQLRGEDANTFDPARMFGGLATGIAVTPLKVLQAGTAAQRIGQGAKIGAAMGAASPVYEEGSFLGDKLVQIAGGAAAGAIFPAAFEAGGALGRGVRNLVQPLLPGGERIAAGRLAGKVAGENADEVIRAMQSARIGETAGQAAVPAGSAEFSALQKIAERFRPSEYAGIEKAQQGVREGVLESMAGRQPVGGTDVLGALEASRKAATRGMYEQANKGASPVITGVLDDLDSMITRQPGNKELVTALTDIKKGLLAGRAGTGLPDRATAEAVSSSIDGIKSAIAKKDNAYIQGALINFREKLKNLLPEYRAADVAFKQRSIPINQMNIVREFQAKLASPTGAETAGTYLRTLDDAAKIIKDSTGMSRYTELGQVMNPAQMGKLKYIAQDLEKNLELARLARKGADATGRIVGEAANPIQQVKLLNRAVTVINGIFSRMEGKGTQKTMQELSKLMQDPEQMAKAMLEARPGERKALVDAIVRLQAIPASQAVAQ